MRSPGFLRQGIRVALVGLALMTTGCLTPDRWAAFEADPLPRPAATPDPAFPAAEELQPRRVEPPGSAPTSPGEPWELSLEQAVMLALQNNRDLQVRQLNPVIAGTFEQLERGTYDPELFAGAEYARERANETSNATGERFSVTDSGASVIAGVRQSLPTGTALEASAEHNQNTSNRSPDQQVTRLGLSVTQSLLRGFGSEVNLASVRQAELDTRASVFELRGFTEALLAEVEIGYWNFVLAVREIEIFERSLALARQQLDEIGQQIEVGLLPEVEAAAARAEVARREQAVIAAQSEREERRLRLLARLGHDLATSDVSEIRTTSTPELEPRAITDLADRLQLADRSRPDLAEARLRLEQERLETVVTRNGVLPRLELFLTLGKTGYAETFATSLRELGGDTHDITAGIRFRQLLGNRSAQARDRAAQATRAQAVEAVANLLEIVRLDVRLAANAVERTRLQIVASAVTRGFQEETVSAEQERFDVGASTALSVAQTQRDLLITQIAEVESIIQHRIALTQLYLAEGSLLERRGVQLVGGSGG
ncbi:MAG: TolC family protein [Deferrisomatales bacterium]|nr:TolC family protein [Deferrisomatales bacterium]